MKISNGTVKEYWNVVADLFLDIGYLINHNAMQQIRNNSLADVADVGTKTKTGHFLDALISI